MQLVKKNIVLSNHDGCIYCKKKSPYGGYDKLQFSHYRLNENDTYMFLGKRKPLYKRIFSEDKFDGKTKDKSSLDLWSIDKKEFLEEIKTLDAEHLQMLSSNLTALKLEVDALLIDVL